MASPLGMSDVGQLGAPLAQYKSGVARIILAIVGLVFVAFAVFAVGATLGDTSSLVVGVIAGLIFGGMGLYCLWSFIASRGTRVGVFADGFTYTRAGKTASARWSEVAAITQRIVRSRYYGIPIWTSYRYDLTLANGQRVRFDTMIGKVAKLGETAQAQIANALLPRAIETYRQGLALPFGKFSVSQAGIANGNETLPWTELESMTFQNGRLIIKKRGKRLSWASAPVYQIPNVYVLRSLTDYIMRGGR